MKFDNKVLKGLEICGKGEPCCACPYWDRHRNDGEKDEIACTDELFLDASAEIKRLLKENEQFKKRQAFGKSLCVKGIPKDAIIFTKDKWLVINMESKDLGDAIKGCVDYLTKNARGNE